MHLRIIAVFFILLAIYSCDSPAKKKQANTSITNTSSPTESKDKKHANEKVIPVFGYRFTITGDFDGSGHQEKLTEHFFSGIDDKETNKFYDNLNYDSAVAVTMKKKPYCFVSDSDNRIAKLLISSNPQQFGVAYLKNEGDLNGDGTDEVSYVVNWADWSNLNTCYIMTYRQGKWEKLYSFPVWDWQLPDMPKVYTQYGPFGLQNRTNVKSDTANARIEKNFNDFKGLIKKVSNNKIQIIFRSDEPSLDTAIIDLQKPHKFNK